MPDNLFFIPLINFHHRLSKEYDLGEGFGLEKFPKEFDLEYRTFGHSYFKRHFGDNLIKEAKDAYCLRYDWPGEKFKSIQDMVYKIEDPAITFLIALRLLKPTGASFKMVFHTPSLTDGLPFDFTEYRMIGYPFQTPKEIQKFVEDDIHAGKFLFLKLLSLLKNEFRYRRIFNTLRYFDLGYRSANIDSRVIYFTIALEVLYKPSRGKITKVMAERISAFLGKGKEKREISPQVHEIMNFKARLTHGDMTYFDISRPERIKLVQVEEDLVRRSIRTILKNDQLIETFSHLRNREDYFHKLT